MTFYEYTLENSPIMARPDCHSACNFGSDAISMIFTATQVAPINLA
jgi:hypothetical protein